MTTTSTQSARANIERAEAETGRQWQRLALLVNARRDLDLEIAGVVGAMRAAGESWERIGSALGVSRQAAHERYGR